MSNHTPPTQRVITVTLTVGLAYESERENCWTSTSVYSIVSAGGAIRAASPNARIYACIETEAHSRPSRVLAGVLHNIPRTYIEPDGRRVPNDSGCRVADAGDTAHLDASNANSKGWKRATQGVVPPTTDCRTQRTAANGSSARVPTKSIRKKRRNTTSLSAFASRFGNEPSVFLRCHHDNNPAHTITSRNQCRPLRGNTPDQLARQTHRKFLTTTGQG